MVSPGTVHADNHCKDYDGSSSFLGFPTWYEYLDVADDCSISLPQKDESVDIGATVSAILFAAIEILLRIAGIVAVGYVIYGGILFSMSQGQPEQLSNARKTIINGLVGLVLAVFAVAIVNIVTNILLA